MFYNNIIDGNIAYYEYLMFTRLQFFSMKVYSESGVQVIKFVH